MSRTPGRRGSFTKLTAGLVATAALTVASLVATTLPAAAFKPYTHNATAQNAYDDVVADGQVTIEGEDYTVRTEIVTALQNQPEAYNAGVIGPDGFPDLAYGQSSIHPEETGKWLQHVLTKAWDAQDDPGRSIGEKEKILAFAYGFLTHAAGDMWAHTLINKVAEGVFPGVGEILSDTDAAEIALRHVIAEGYVGDATPGFDGNPLRGAVGGDWSDDATPAFEYEAPSAWIYETLVNPANALPVGTCGDGVDDDHDDVADDGCPGGPFTVGEESEPNRGPLIDYFIDLRADLEVERAKIQADLGHEECAIKTDDCRDYNLPVQVNTVRGIVNTSIPVMACLNDPPCLWDPVDEVDDAVINPPILSYLNAWIDDIDRGLRHWPELGQALSRTLFDAGTYREVQNFWCSNDAEEFEVGVEFEALETDRAKCEDGIGIAQVAGYTLAGLNDKEEPGFINEYLLSMLGAPDFVGEVVEEGGTLFLWLKDLMETVMPDVDFLDPVLADAKDLVMDLVSESLGFDVEQLSAFLKHPTYWMEVGSADIDVPFSDDPLHLDLFDEGDREYLDGVMHLVDPLVGTQVEMPDGTLVPSSRLKDSAQWDLESFEPAYDAVQMAKMLLLDANGLNQVISDHRSPNLLPGVPTAIYLDPTGRPANVMVDGLDGSPWLRSIDSDHSWRADRLPVFTTPDPGHHTDEAPSYAGTGQMPLWESCVARSTFRDVFRDWENGSWYYEFPKNNFPDLGDAPSAPTWIAGSLTSDIAITGDEAIVGGVQWVGVDHTFTVTAADESFTAESLKTSYSVHPAGVAGTWTTVAGNVAAFVLPADADENLTWVLDWTVSSECETISGTRSVRVDRTAPVVQLTEPAATGYDTDDFASVQYTITDSLSGVETQSVQFDGTEVPTGYVLDMFTLNSGAHAAVATATDFVGNTGSATRAFTLLATTESLSNNLTRAVAEQLVTDPKVEKGLRDKLNAALKSHATAKHPTEVNQLAAVRDQLLGQAGKGVDATYAARMVGWTNDLIAVHK